MSNVFSPPSTTPPTSAGNVAPGAAKSIQLGTIQLPSPPGKPPRFFSGIPGEMMFECSKIGAPNSANAWRRCQMFARGGSMVDVGANIGGNIVTAADFFRHCYAIEPSSVNASILRHNIEINHFTNVDVLQMAISNTSGMAKLYLDGSGNDGAHSLSAAQVGGGKGFEEVPMRTLDAALPAITEVTFLHIDTEGNDIKVLQGAREFIRRQALKPIIEIEFSPRALARSGSSVGELICFLDELGYQVQYDANNNLVPLSRTVVLELFYLWMNTGGWIDLLLFPAGPKFQ